jgi:hypothetical protein
LAVENTLTFYKNCYKVKIRTEDGLRILREMCRVEVSTSLISRRWKEGEPRPFQIIDFTTSLPGSPTSIYRIGVSDVVAQAFVECLGEDYESIVHDQEALAEQFDI